MLTIILKEERINITARSTDHKKEKYHQELVYGVTQKNFLHRKHKPCSNYPA
jgi:hypothetical protein